GPPVLLMSGERLSVQLMNRARRSSYGMKGLLQQFGVLFDVHERGSVGREQSRHRRVQLIAPVDPDSGGTAQSGEARPVGVVQGGVPDRVVLGELVLADLPARVVVEE